MRRDCPRSRAERPFEPLTVVEVDGPAANSPLRSSDGMWWSGQPQGGRKGAPVGNVGCPHRSTVTRKITKTLILGAAILCAAAANASEAVRVRVPLAMLRAPADIRIYVMVERHEDNRLLRVSAESSEFFRSSEVALEGDRSARVTLLYFRELPPGEYVVAVELIGADGKTRGRAHSSLMIM